jgi:uncharacterized protein YyaL (SSP411 family)
MLHRMNGRSQVRMKGFLAYTVAIVMLVQGAVFGADFRFSPRPNAAYLVQWREWGDAAFAEARSANKLVLLSLSAVWCHWCHVMDETTYSDTAVIDLINERFIPVRVDADLRPDVDSLYNQGGWPSTAILTPQGEVITGGNYIPPAEMLQMLTEADELFATDRERIDERLKTIAEQRRLRQAGISGPPDRAMVDGIVDLLADVFDERYGGFGSGQKFPNPDALELLFAAYAQRPDGFIKKMLTATLDGMAKGGIRDAVEGGFFRYATKQDWSEPHYEKMLEVNAGLIAAYARAYQVLRSERYRATMEESIGYVLRMLRDAPSGALFGSQDADEEYYRPGSRRKRTPPHVDRTTYTDASSLMISALVAAWESTGEQRHLDAAAQAADQLARELYRSGTGVYHALRDGRRVLSGQLEDNVLFGLAMLDLYNATGKRRYLDRAARIGQLVAGRFYDEGRKRFHATLGSAGITPVSPGGLAQVNDNRANYRAVRFLARLSYRTGDRKAREMAEAALATLSRDYRDFTPQAPSYGLAARWIVHEPVEMHVLAEGVRAQEYLRAAARVYLPEKVVKVLSLVDDREEIKSYGYKARESVYICAGKRCSRPVRDPAALPGALKQFLEAGTSQVR